MGWGHAGAHKSCLSHCLALQVIDQLGITHTSRMNSFNVLPAPSVTTIVSEMLFASRRCITSDRRQLKLILVIVIKSKKTERDSSALIFLAHPLSWVLLSCQIVQLHFPAARQQQPEGHQRDQLCWATLQGQSAGKMHEAVGCDLAVDQAGFSPAHPSPWHSCILTYKPGHSPQTPLDFPLLPHAQQLLHQVRHS